MGSKQVSPDNRCVCVGQGGTFVLYKNCASFGKDYRNGVK